MQRKTRVFVNAYNAAWRLPDEQIPQQAYHSSISVFEKEYVFRGRVLAVPVGAIGEAMFQIDLGETEITEDVFENFVKGLMPKYNPSTYHIFKCNRNHFTAECCKFFGKECPAILLELPSQAVQEKFERLEAEQEQLATQLMGAIADGVLSAPAQMLGIDDSMLVDEIVHELVDVTDFYEEVLDSGPPRGVVIYVYSSAVPQSMMVRANFESVAEEFTQKYENINFFRVNMQAPGGSDIAQQMAVTSSPVFITYAKGERVETYLGTELAGLKKLSETLAQQMKSGGYLRENSAPRGKFKVFRPGRSELFRYTPGDLGAVCRQCEDYLRTKSVPASETMIISQLGQSPDSMLALAMMSVDERRRLFDVLTKYLELNPTENPASVPLYDLYRIALSDLGMQVYYIKNYAKHFESVLASLVTRVESVFLGLFSDAFFNSLPVKVKVNMMMTLVNLFSTSEGFAAIKKNFAVLHEHIIIDQLKKSDLDKGLLGALIMLTYNAITAKQQLNIPRDLLMKYEELLIDLIKRERDDQILQAAVLTLMCMIHGDGDMIKYARGEDMVEFARTISSQTRYDALAKILGDLLILLQ
jgi:hypothetical protein